MPLYTYVLDLCNAFADRHSSFYFFPVRKRKIDEAEFAKFVSEADAFKAVTHKIMNLSFSGKQRLLRGVLDGPIAIGSSTLIPHVGHDPEDEMMKILHSCGMTVRHNQPLLLELLTDKHTVKSL
jgi:hypothetical protein